MINVSWMRLMAESEENRGQGYNCPRAIRILPLDEVTYTRETQRSIPEEWHRRWGKEAEKDDTQNQLNHSTLCVETPNPMLKGNLEDSDTEASG